MSKAFPEPGKGFPKALASLRAATQSGGVLDNEPRTSGASPIVLDPTTYKHLITTGGTAGNEIVQLPSAPEIGARCLIVFDVEGNASDTVRVNGDGTSTLETAGILGDAAAAAVTNVDLDTPGEFVLCEYRGGDVWNLLYSDGLLS